MHTGLCKDTYYATVFENVTPVYKKVPGTVHAHTCRRSANSTMFTVWELVTTVYR